MTTKKGVDDFGNMTGPSWHGDAKPVRKVGRSGEPHCTAIIATDPASRIAELEDGLAAMAEQGAAFVRVGNPLRAPLTLQRMLIQIGSVELCENSDEEEEARFYQLLERRAASGPIVLIIEQAETLAPGALLPLQRLASGSRSIRILFVGEPSFWTLLNGDDLAPLRLVLTSCGSELTSVTPSPEVHALALQVLPLNPLISFGPVMMRPIAPMSRSGRRWWIGSLAGLSASLAVMAVLTPGDLFHSATPQMTPLPILWITTPLPAPVPSLQPAVEVPTRPTFQLLPATPYALQVSPTSPPAGVKLQQSGPRSKFVPFLAASSYDMDTINGGRMSGH